MKHYQNVGPGHYDMDILSKSVEEQIETYYKPEKIEDRRRIEAVINALSPSRADRILDIGCGVGTFAYHSAVAGALAAGIDYSSESISTAEKICNMFPLKNKPEFIVSRIDDIPFSDNSFDKAVAADIIEHLSGQEKEGMLNEARRVIKPGGKLVVFTPNALRDKIGLMCKRIMFRKINHWNVEAHFGLIGRKGYEKLLDKGGFNYSFRYLDITRPWLAHIPVLKRVLALNMLWEIRV